MMYEENMNSIELNDEALEEVSGGKSANQKIKATGNVNVRKGPGLDYVSMGTISKGMTLTFLGSVKKDGRGVAWYKVKFNGAIGWVSSKYAKIA